MFSICKTFPFEAHHRLPHHQGKCARDHGHSYRLEIEVHGPIQGDSGRPDSGMVMDFDAISAVVKPLIEQYADHHSLNDIHTNPTAEHIVEWFAAMCASQLPGLVRVRLWETATAYAEWTAR